MGAVISFSVLGEPKPNPRGRAFSRGGHARVYDPGTAEGWKAAVALAARPFLPTEPLAGPVALELDFLMPRPKRLSRRCDDPGELWHTSKPDLDNIEKAVLDALTQIGLWRDDCQVVAVSKTKRYHALNGRPGARVTVREVEP